MVPLTHHFRSLERREDRPRASVTSAGFIALGKSCLFARTSRTASRRSSSCGGQAREPVRGAVRWAARHAGPRWAVCQG